MSLVSFRGINVYEPTWQILKAAAHDLAINTPHRLRWLSFVIHAVNSLVLLPSWMRLRLKYRDDKIVTLVSLLFAVHPLNVQVIGWLSAQGYLYALFFALLSSISFEHTFGLHPDRAQLGKIDMRQTLYSLLSLFCFFLACYSKAPAIMLAPFLLLQSFCIMLESTRNFKSLIAYIIGISLTAAISITQIVVANQESSIGMANVGHIDSFQGRVLRGILIVWNFTTRLFVPSDLRIHYCPGEAILFDTANFFATKHLSLSQLRPETAPTLINQLITPSFLLYIMTATICLSAYGMVCLYMNDQNSIKIASSWWTYIMFWLPCMGLVSHGWHSLGADRYIYLPMAFAVAPAIVNALHMYIYHKKHECVTPSDDKIMQFRRRWGFFVLLLYAVVFTLETRRHVNSWQNDYTILNACIDADPTDYECHEYLGQFYGHHLQLMDKSKFHLEKALFYFPRSPQDFKSALVRAHILLVLERKEEACKTITNSFFYAQSLYENSTLDGSWIGSFRGSKSPIPLIMNNYVLCQVAYNLTSSHVDLMTPLLQKAYKIMHDEKNTDGNFIYSQEDRASIAEHLQGVIKWQPGMDYNSIFMW